MTTDEGNKIIGEFMGVKLGEDTYMWRPGAFTTLEVEHLAYHREWGWSMPVVSKFELMDNPIVMIRIDCYEVSAYALDFNLRKEFAVVEYADKNKKLTDEEKKELVWKMLVRLIEWYNKIK